MKKSWARRPPSTSSCWQRSDGMSRRRNRRSIIVLSTTTTVSLACCLAATAAVIVLLAVVWQRRFVVHSITASPPPGDISDEQSVVDEVVSVPSRRPKKKPDGDNSNSTTNQNRILHIGRFGLGHRLSKLSAAYHLAERMDVPILDAQWHDCGGNNNDHAKNNGGDDNNDINNFNMFRHLFQSSEVPIIRGRTTSSIRSHDDHDDSSSSLLDRQNKTILVRNDVHGYYAGQAYKNYQIPLDEVTIRRWNEKLDSDRRFFFELQHRFTTRYHHALHDFQQLHHWDDHHVIGVHIRTGNGETGHFTTAQRTTWHHNNSTQVIPRVLEELIGQLRSQQQSLSQEKETTTTASSSSSAITKPLLVFVATDTEEWINILRAALGSVPVISFPQPRVERGQGVSFSTWTKNNNNNNNTNTSHCVAGWIASAMDMFLLAASDTLVATTRSTFTQILPLSLVLAKGGSFCEVRTTNTTTAATPDDDHFVLACFADLYQWLGIDRVVTTPATSSTNDDGAAHKVMVHLPDVFDVNNIDSSLSSSSDRVLEEARRFLVSTAPVADNDDARVYYYGRVYNPRYREKRPFQTSWTYKRL
jgi:hypothetical protein